MRADEAEEDDDAGEDEGAAEKRGAWEDDEDEGAARGAEEEDEEEDAVEEDEEAVSHRSSGRRSKKNLYASSATSSGGPSRRSMYAPKHGMPDARIQVALASARRTRACATVRIWTPLSRTSARHGAEFLRPSASIWIVTARATRSIRGLAIQAPPLAIERAYVCIA
jgi:hypothetical protein